MPGPATSTTGSVFTVPQFDEQVFLMYNLCYFSKDHFNDHYKRHQPYSKIRMLKGNNTALMNSLLNKDYPDKEPLLNITQAQLSQVVPSIRIYKQYYNPSSQDLVKEIEFLFPNYTSADSILQEGGRGGYGLVSFDIESQGTTFYTADKQFTAKLNLFFQTFDEMTKIRTGVYKNEDHKYSFLDLIVQPFPNPDSPDERDRAITSDPSQFRIRVDVGWASPNASTLTRDIKDAIRKTRTSFFLYLTDHDIQINQDGTINLNINYIGAFDFINRDVRAGIILNKDNKQIYDELTKKVKDASNKATEAAPNTQEIESARGDLNTFIANVGPESYQEIISDLMTPTIADKDGVYRSRIYQTAISPIVKEQFCYIAGGDLELTEFFKRRNAAIAGARPTSTTLNGLAGQLYDIFTSRASSIPQKIDFCKPSSIFSLRQRGTGNTPEDPMYYYITPVKSNVEPSLAADQFATDPILVDSDGNEYTHISWFYLGDLLEVLMKRAFNEDISETDANLLLTRFGADFSKRVKIILSDIKYKSTCSSHINRMNLAHIPISLKKFNIFFYNKVVTARNLNYTMDDFIRDFINNFVKDVFLDKNTINNRVFKQNINLKYINIATLLRDTDKEPLPPDSPEHFDITRLEQINKTNFLLSNDIEGKPDKYFFYMMIFQDVYDPTTLTGNMQEDALRGIPHIYTGRDRGIVKTVNFKKTALPYKREERIASTNKDYNPVIQLSSLYNVDLETYGNTIFMVGSYFFLVPSGMGSTSLGMPNEARSISNIMGLGGYYFINKITWSIESGKFISNITGIHQATGAKDRAANGQSTINIGEIACTEP
jgi:hypothetical protein